MNGALLKILNLNHHFGGLQTVINFDLDIAEGELIGLIGPNGAGKTTIFNIVSGIYAPAGGSIIFQEKEITGLSPHQVTSLGIARTFQNIRLWKNMTVFENLCISQHNRLNYGIIGSIFQTGRFRRDEATVRKTADEMMDIMGLKEYAAEYPANLPYGLQRRVEIARALTVRPKLLLLDEPAAGMNPAEVAKLIDLIQWIKKRFDLTIWLIEHHMRVVMALCRRITVLEFGKIIADGSSEQVRNNPDVIKAYLGEEDSQHA